MRNNERIKQKIWFWDSEIKCCNRSVHMLLKIAPKYSVSWILWILKWKSAVMLHNLHWKKKMLWQKKFWSRWYFVNKVWVDLEVVKKYIENQNKKDKVEDWEQLDFNL